MIAESEADTIAKAVKTALSVSKSTTSLNATLNTDIAVITMKRVLMLKRQAEGVFVSREVRRSLSRAKSAGGEIAISYTTKITAIGQPVSHCGPNLKTAIKMAHNAHVSGADSPTIRYNQDRRDSVTAAKSNPIKLSAGPEYKIERKLKLAASAVANNVTKCAIQIIMVIFFINARSGI
jgi:hypothetical protein